MTLLKVLIRKMLLVISNYKEISSIINYISEAFKLFLSIIHSLKIILHKHSHPYTPLKQKFTLTLRCPPMFFIVLYIIQCILFYFSVLKNAYYNPQHWFLNLLTGQHLHITKTLLR